MSNAPHSLVCKGLYALAIFLFLGLGTPSLAHHNGECVLPDAPIKFITDTSGEENIQLQKVKDVDIVKRLNAWLKDQVSDATDVLDYVLVKHKTRTEELDQMFIVGVAANGCTVLAGMVSNSELNKIMAGESL